MAKRPARSAKRPAARSTEDRADEAALTAPTDRDGLHRWIQRHLGVDLPRRAVVSVPPGSLAHAAPFDYIAWTFLDSLRPQGARAPSPSDDPDVPDAVVWANRGGGKTLLGAVATALDMAFRPGIEVRILAGSLEQAQRMHRHLQGFFSRRPLAGLVAGRVTDRRIRLTNGSAVELIAQSQTAIRGTRVQRLRCDEVELFDPAVWEAAQLTTRSKVCGETLVPGSIECLSTMHIPHGLMHRLVAEAREGRRRLFKWGVVDVLARCGPEHACGEGTDARCPLWEECGGRAKQRPGNEAGVGVGHLAVRDVAGMKSRVSLPVWEAEMLCLRPRRDDSVLPEFSPGVHVVESVPPPGEGSRSVGGMDFGYRAPTVVLWAVVDASGVLWVTDELIRRGHTVAENAEAVRDPARPELAWIGVDPAGNNHNEQTGRTAVEVLKAAGITVRAARLPVARGLELVRARLRPAAAGLPRVFIHRRCVGLIESLEKYHYPEDTDSMDPVKDGSDHAVDALRYLVQNLDGGGGSRTTNYLGRGWGG